LDLARERRLGNVQPHSRSTDPGFFRNRHKITQMTQIHKKHT